MGRPASGKEQIEVARALLREAKTVEQLRQAQAVLLPLELGLSLEQTAAAIGRSVSATCAMRTRFVAVRAGRREAARPKRELRNRATVALEREGEILDEVLKGAADCQCQFNTPHLCQSKSPHPLTLEVEDDGATK